MNAFGKTFILGAIIAVTAAGFFMFQMNAKDGAPAAEETESPEMAAENENRPEENTAEENDISDIPFTVPVNQARVMQKEFFSIILPPKWAEVQPLGGTLTIIANPSETYEDIVLRESGFKSYFSVSRNEIGERSWDDAVKETRMMVNASAPGIKFNSELAEEKDGLRSHLIDADFTRGDEGDFKVLIYIEEGKNNDFWVLTFNTGKEKWKDYFSLAPEVLESFVSR